ncbi:uncharacterized protein LOC125756455 [Rhipicephalus sanguineus]|uniref:uncharacterized protein LOC125756455 n=1 Tax=Rhipicephalus sanguineus TaxID=34632 RepID=UPI0020C57173|nr:uncharacterized protein LOC125756455 [Rhipicephalus sanguineus]
MTEAFNMADHFDEDWQEVPPDEDECDEAAQNEEPFQGSRGSYFDDLEYETRRKSERELFRYRSRHGLLDIERIDVELFKLQFRFEKEDLGELASALLLPQAVVSAQNVTVSGQAALCLTLRRVAYPSRWCDLEKIFGLHASVMSSVASKMFCHITSNFGHLLDDCNNSSWLSPLFALIFLQAVARKEAPLRNCWAFIDGTARPNCRSKRNQEQYYSGHKRCHCVKYQYVMCPNGIICQLDGPYPERRHDADEEGFSFTEKKYYTV